MAAAVAVVVVVAEDDDNDDCCVTSLISRTINVLREDASNRRDADSDADNGDDVVNVAGGDGDEGDDLESVFLGKRCSALNVHQTLKRDDDLQNLQRQQQRQQQLQPALGHQRRVDAKRQQRLLQRLLLALRQLVVREKQETAERCVRHVVIFYDVYEANVVWDSDWHYADSSSASN